MTGSSKFPVTVLTGFLGSGKTTLLRRWQRDETLQGAALIIHDLSELGIDAELLSSEGAATTAGELHDRVAALHGIHARDQLKSSLELTLAQIADLTPPPPQVLCESTGAARPWPLISALTQDSRFFLRHFIVTVDALNLHRDFSDGRILTGEQDRGRDPALQHAAEVLAEQLAFASVIILTKVDAVDQSIVASQVDRLRQLRPSATVALSAQAGLLLGQLDATPAPELSSLRRLAERLGLSDTSATAAQVDATVIRDSRPFHPERLHEAVRNNLGTGMYRTKGYLWMASRPGQVLLWQQSGSQVALELTGHWRAEILRNADGRLLPEEIDFLKGQLQSAHPLFGDRVNELTLIGLKDARVNFARALRSALCTDEEVAAWQRGETFPDPWPQSIREIE